MISELERSQLVTAAVNARLNAYAPYSKFRVGAAVLADSGKVFAGCNVENASYGLTICAERSAIFKAVSEGEKRLTALVLCLEGGGSPCGACRQVIHEFGPGIPILTCDSGGQLVFETTLDRLLPEAFGPNSLGGQDSGR
jgi:cytidine deaminase